MVLAVVLAPVRCGFAQFSASVYDEVKPGIVQISCNGRMGTGFLWSSPDTAVTALHVVSGCGTVTVYFEKEKVQRTAKLARVLRRADLALLQIATPPPGRVLTVEPNAPSLTEPLSVLGYPLQIPSMTNTPLRLRYGGSVLKDIVPESVRGELASAGSPSLELEIDFIEGHLLPGNSGAPIFNQQRRIVAIADGGLDNGAAAVSWGIPAKFLAQLASSNESTSTQGGQPQHALFAAESEVKNRGEMTCSGLTLTKLRTATFTQLSKSVDSPVGLVQLVQFFQIDPSSFTFDVYQHLPSGATFVVPEGAQLKEDANGDCVAQASTGHIEMHLQLGVMGSPTEAQSRAQRFELAWGGNPQGWIADPQWSNWVPVYRFDGLVVQRKAYSHVSNVYPNFLDQYGFEAVALRKNTFIGLSTKYGWTPQIQQAVAACRMSPAAPQCSDVMRFMMNWVRSVLAVQLTTFPVG